MDDVDAGTSNDKRRETCRKIGAMKKQEGHDIEKLFNSLYGDPSSALTYKPQADSEVSFQSQNGHSIMLKFIQLGWMMDRYSVSIKSGNNLQFHLGNIPELSQLTEHQSMRAVLQSSMLWSKYLKKSTSSLPAELLCYYHKQSKEWTFFRMDHVIDMITQKCTWRFLPTGRIKGDFADGSRKGASQYITYEYRKGKHNSYFLGVNGNKGVSFIKLCKNNLDHIII